MKYTLESDEYAQLCEFVKSFRRFCWELNNFTNIQIADLDGMAEDMRAPSEDSICILRDLLGDFVTFEKYNVVPQ